MSNFVPHKTKRVVPRDPPDNKALKIGRTDSLKATKDMVTNRKT